MIFFSAQILPKTAVRFTQLFVLGVGVGSFELVRVKERFLTLKKKSGGDWVFPFP